MCRKKEKTHFYHHFLLLNQVSDVNKNKSKNNWVYFISDEAEKIFRFSVKKN